MQIDIVAIEKVCNELWSLITELRELAVTARRAVAFKLTTEQKKALKQEFLRVKTEIRTKLNEILSE